MTTENFTMVDRLKRLPLLSATQEILEYPKLQMEDEKARVYVIEPNWNFSFQINWDNGPLVCARFLALYVALPFFALYGSCYNAAMAAVKLTASAVFLFRKEDDQARRLAANAVQHVAFAVYDFALGFFTKAPLLYIPVLPMLYAFAPGPVLRAHRFLTHETEGLLTAKTYTCIMQILTKTEAARGENLPSTPRRWRLSGIALSDISPASLTKFFVRLVGTEQEEKQTN